MVAQCENVRVSESVSDAHKIELENLENEEDQGHSPCGSWFACHTTSDKKNSAKKLRGQEQHTRS